MAGASISAKAATRCSPKGMPWFSRNFWAVMKVTTDTEPYAPAVAHASAARNLAARSSGAM